MQASVLKTIHFEEELFRSVMLCLQPILYTIYMYTWHARPRVYERLCKWNYGWKLEKPLNLQLG